MINILLFRKASALLFWSFTMLFMLNTHESRGQLLTEDFSYSTAGDITTASSSAWTAHSGTTFYPQYTNTGLTYSGYVGSGVGGAVTIGTTGVADVNRTFTNQTQTANGFVYAAFLVNISAVTTTGDYFVHYGQTATGSTFIGKFFVKKDASNNLAFGLSKSAGIATATFTGFSYLMNTTYLVVLKYEIKTGTLNDVITAYINPATSGTEPGSATITAPDPTVADLTGGVGSIAIRQAGANTPAASIDGIRVGTTWASVVPASGTAPVITYNPQTKTYGDTQGFSMTASSTNGVTPITYSGGNAAVATITSAGVVTIVGQGTSTFTASQAAGNGYTSGSTTGTLTVNKAAGIIITANGVSKNYGTALTSGSSSAFGVSGLQYSQNLGISPSVTVTYGTGAAANASATLATVSPAVYLGSDVPSSLVLGSSPTYTAGNYNAPAYVAGNITVSKKDLTITAHNQSVSFGTAVSTVTNAGTFTATGFLSPEDASVLGGSVSYTTNYQNTTPEGTPGITITPVVTSLTSNNYSFTPANGNITVTAANAPSCASSTAIDTTADQSICNGAPATMLTATITNTGGDATNRVLAYQWYYNTTNSNNPSGATEVGTNNHQFTPDNTAIGTRYYFCVGYASNSECGPQSKLTQALASTTVKVMVNAIPTATIVSVTDSSGTASNDGIICAGASATLTASLGDSYLWSPNNETTSSISATTQGNYSVKVTVNGCQSPSSANTFITVNPLPTKPTISGTATVCFGALATLTSSAGNSYLWSNAATTSSVNVGSGTYTVQVINANGCQSVASDATTVTVGSALVVGAVSGITSGTYGSHLVISQVYGGGGNTGALYTTDFIEIYNPTANPIGITGWKVQYASSGGTFGDAATLSVTAGATIGAGKYFLIGLASGAIGAALPTPNATGTTNMSATTGKVRLINNSAAVIDLLGFGTSTIPAFEGAPITGLTGNVKSYHRKAAGCTDTDNNSNDFEITLDVAPRNSTTTASSCATTSYTETICSGTTPSAITVTAASGSISPYTYVWYSHSGFVTPSGDTTGWTAAAGAITNGGLTFTPSAITANTTYACFVTPSAGCAAAWATNNRQVTVNPLPSASIATTLSAVCAGTGTNVTITGTANAHVLYKINGGSDIATNLDATGSVVLATGNLSSDVTYTLVKVTNSTTNCFLNLNATATVTVHALPAQPTITPPGPISFYAGGNVTLTSSTSSSYLWSTTETTASINVTTAGSYTVRVTDGNGCQSIASATTEVTIRPMATFTGIVQGEALCPGTGNTEFGILGLEAANTNYTLYYKIGSGTETSHNFTTDSFSNGSVFIALTALDNGASLTVTGIEFTGESASKFVVNPVNEVSVITLNVYTNSVAPTNIVGATTICPFEFTVLGVDGGTLGNGATVEWFADACGSSVIGTGNSIIVSPAANTTYFVRFTGCNTTSCVSQLVTVNTLSVEPTGATGTTTVCSGTGTSLTVDGGSKGTAAQTRWRTGSCNGTLVHTGDTLNTGNLTTDTTYYVSYSGTCNDTACATVTVTVTSLSTSTASLTSSDLDNTFAYGTSVTFTASAANLGGGTASYNFKVNGVSAQSGASTTYVVSNLSNSDQVSLVVTVSGGTCLTSTTATSNTITNTVTGAYISVITTYCGQTLPVINAKIRCSVPTGLPGGATLGYMVKVRNTANVNNVAVTFSSSVANFNLTMSSVYTYSTVFEVQVAAVVNGVVQPYSAICLITTPGIPANTVTEVQCGATLTELSTRIYASAVLGSQLYRWKVRLSTDVDDVAHNKIYTSLSSSFRLTNVPGLAVSFGKTYKVAVQSDVLINGSIVTSPYSTECNVVTPSIATITSAQCGNDLTTIDQRIYINSIIGANQYTYRVALASAPTTFYEFTTTVTNFRLTSVPGLPLTFATAYLLSVKVRLTIDTVDYFSGYSNPCTITTPEPVTVGLEAAYCTDGNVENPGPYQVPTVGSLIYCEFVSGAYYTFVLQQVDASNNPIGSPLTSVLRSVNNIKLQNIPGVVADAFYKVSIILTYFGEGEAGKGCTIHTPAAVARENDTVKVTFSARAYPNPFANNFMIDVKTRSESVVSLKVYDMIGRLVEERSVSVSNLETTPIGDNYPSGVYNVVVTQGDEVKTVRAVKR